MHFNALSMPISVPQIHIKIDGKKNHGYCHGLNTEIIANHHKAMITINAIQVNKRSQITFRDCGFCFCFFYNISFSIVK